MILMFNRVTLHMRRLQKPLISRAVEVLRGLGFCSTFLLYASLSSLKQDLKECPRGILLLDHGSSSSGTSSRTSGKEHLTHEDHANYSHGYVGLRNYGATGYLNTALQTLFMTETFREAVLRMKNPKGNTVSSELQKLFRILSSGEKAASTMGIIRVLNIGNVREQRDAAEYLEKILSLVDPELSEVFVGEKIQRMVCEEKCGRFTETSSSFFFIPITLNPEPDGVVNVINCFNAHFSAEMMTGRNQLFCHKCKKETGHEKTSELSKVPEVLILHLNRFQFDPTYNSYKKDNSTVSIPHHLCVEGDTYDLYAVVSHTGTLGGGHYYVNIKSFEDGQWYEFNDSMVYPKPNKARSLYLSQKRNHGDPKNPERVLRSDSACMVLFKPPERMPQTTPAHPEKDPTERRILLLGKTGGGKSAAGNTILGETRFRSEFSSSSVTAQCEMEEAVVAGRRVCVVDTIGLFDTNISPEDLAVEIGRSVYLSSPGPHAFLYVQPINIKFTQQEEEVVQKLEQMFGEEMRKYTIVLFTHEDQLEGESVENVIRHNISLSRLVDQCGGYHVFNNKDLENRQQVTDLLEKIDRMVVRNGGSGYSNEIFRKTERCRMEKEQRVRREEDARQQRENEQRQEEIEIVKKETEERIREEMERLEQRELRQDRIRRQKTERGKHENDCSVS